MANTFDKDRVIALIAKAAKATDSSDAMRFSQAACNAANALQVLIYTEIATKGDKP